MKKNIFKWGIAVLACQGVVAQSIQENQADSLKVNQLDEVVVSDSRFQLKRENSGKTVIKITAEEIASVPSRTLAELINSKSGIEINGNRSVAGQNLGYFIRGGNNRQVLVIVDGVQLNDPSQIANDFDLRLLNLNQIESIEILKGAASTLYGNAAATAVINITSKKAAKEKVVLDVVSSMGTNQSQEDDQYNLSNFTNTVAVSGTLNKFDYVASFGNQNTDGLSAANVENAESDAFSRINGSLKLGYRFSEAFNLKVFGSFDEFVSDIDGFPAPNFTFADTNDETKSNQYRVAVQPEYTYQNGSLQLNAGYTNIKRETISDFPSAFDSDLYTIDIFNKYVFNEQFHTIVGLNYQKSETELTELVNFTNTDPYANLVYVSGSGLNVNAGGRLNNHSEYGSHFIYNLNPSYTIQLGEGYAKVLGSYSTSFIVPSLFQLFDGFYGNANLQPEENRTIESGLEINLGKKLRVSGLYFNRDETNTVEFTTIDPVNFVFQYTNGAEATVQGFEFEVETRALDNLTLSANYSFTELKDGVRLRLPKHRANAVLGYEFCEATSASLAYQYAGSRWDTDFATFQNVKLKAFSLVDLFVNHRFKCKNLRVFGGVTNIFNEDYEEIIGYTTRGRNVNLGFGLQL